MNSTRVCWSLVYLFLGILLLIFFITIKKPELSILKTDLTKILWCLSWPAVGIGLGLYNSRNDDDEINRRHRHYFSYFLFVWFIGFLAAFVAFTNFPLCSYAAAALTGIVIGFSGDSLAGKLRLNQWP